MTEIIARRAVSPPVLAPLLETNRGMPISCLSAENNQCIREKCPFYPEKEPI